MRFPNSGCKTTTGLNGTCFTSAECSANGGTATGTCASGFGVCCVGKDTGNINRNKRFLSNFKIWKINAGQHSNSNDPNMRNYNILKQYLLVIIKHFAFINSIYNYLKNRQNPGYSTSYTTAGQCSLYINKCSSNICQLRCVNQRWWQIEKECIFQIKFASGAVAI